MLLIRVPITADPAVVADTVARAPEASLADVLLAQAFGAGTSWEPFYARREIPRDTWTRWSEWLLRRLEHEITNPAQISVVSPNAQWLARTLDELAQQAGPHRVHLHAALRAHLSLACGAGRIWWRAQLAASLAAGHLGPTTGAEVAGAIQPWLDARAPLQPFALTWIVPALTAGLGQDVLTSGDVAQFLERGGAQALWPHVAQERAMLAVPGWRAAWWAFLGGTGRNGYAEVFRAHCNTFAVAWSTWSAAEITEWWSWMLGTVVAQGNVLSLIPSRIEAMLAREPDGVWLAAQPAFHLAMRPLLESSNPTVREIGLRVLGTSAPRLPGGTSPPAARGR